MESRLDARRKAFKKGVDGDDARRKREDEAVLLRKVKKDEQMQKKRQMVDPEAQEGQDLTGGAENAAPNVLGGKVCGKPTSSLASTFQQLSSQEVDPTDRLALTIELRRKLSQARNPPTQEAIDAGLVPLMVQYLQQTQEAQLQFEAAWVLTNIASGESHQTLAVVQGGAVPHFVQLLLAPSMELREQAVWALANIAGDSAKLRDHVLQFDPLTPILELVVQSEGAGKVKMLQNATWALGNFCRGKPAPPMESIVRALPFLARLIHHTDEDVLQDSLWALSYFSDGSEERVQAVIEAGAVGRMVQLLEHPSDKVVQPALRALGNCATGTDFQTSVLVECGVLRQLPQLFGRSKQTHKKEALWLLSNVTAGTQPQIQAVLDAGLAGQVMQVVQLAGSFMVEKEGIWAVANALVGSSPLQVSAWVEAGALQLLASKLEIQDAATLGIVLEALGSVLKVGKQEEEAGAGVNRFGRILEEADGLSKLEQLQEDANQEVYEKAVHLLTTYFEQDDGMAEAAAPSTPGHFDFA